MAAAGGSGGTADRSVASLMDKLGDPAEGVLRVACDLDEVLGFFVRPMLQVVEEKYGVKTDYDNFFSYHYADVWGCTDEESMERVEAFLATEAFKAMERVPLAAETLRRLKDTGKFEFVLVTSRQHSVEADTRAWLREHFRGIFSAVVFGNHYGRSGAKTSKTDLCKALQASVLIDDRVKYCAEVAPSMRRVLLFGDYAWNRAGTSKEDPSELPDNVDHVLDWTAVEEVLMGLWSEVAASKAAAAAATSAPTAADAGAASGASAT
uniref:5'-nucleotidase n=1 Tax=Bicosoecida sp. CB-2014 TaxID=1486930 RepID=A0A7S1C603_9STRA|mmetsp:Transcript_1505/g.4748  ORF Transcript_1505/g.4748 Transcript_1505/m.4748 type:complete len:265 (+) Transcript_1505:190-984(+)|eukprot:CAMPEP_0203820688 /NCGR_PEP_ID=MMETSP0115-20131106/40735_1 /ASSEMBLY_ACC=CAM_ASM_000227 /TAXON_ID=33651 /ORGANISM="Bicosoecid sp, Strain ms1" /LENGTH=264 /DNA_ID=CAMNT_0050729703 /DNA_START=117 /DNA_END=911 /DNA_ORIENTATION=+